MSRYRFLIDFSEAPGFDLDDDKVRFLTDVFSDSFKFRNRDVVAREDIEPQLLERLEASKLVEPYMTPREGKTFYRTGSVVTGESLGDDLIGKLLERGVIEALPPVEAGDEFTMTETPPKKKRRKKKTTE